MSHFAVAVFCHNDDGAELERLLAPYQENNMGDCPKEFLKFTSVEAEHRLRYETDTTSRVKTPDGRLLWPWDETFRVPGEVGHGSNTHKVPEGEGYEKVEIKVAELYPTFEQYMEDYAGYTKDPETGEYGYWENPNAKWDWWQVGGRYSNWFKTKGGQFVNYGQIGELDLTLDQKKYQRALRFWEINVEGAPLQPGESKDDFVNYYRPEYYLNQYGTKEEYATSQADVVPWAFVNFEGVWCEKGKMGWWAANDDTKDSRAAFREAFHKALQDAAPTDYIVLVDCHI